VSFRFGEQAAFHHIEDDFNRVPAIMHAHSSNTGHHHRSKLIQRKLPDAVEQFLAADMADLSRVSFGDLCVSRALRGQTNRHHGYSANPGQDLLHRFVKIDFLHFKGAATWVTAVAGWRSIRFDRPAGQQQTQNNTENIVLFLRRLTGTR